MKRSERRKLHKRQNAGREIKDMKSMMIGMVARPVTLVTMRHLVMMAGYAKRQILNGEIAGWFGMNPATQGRMVGRKHEGSLRKSASKIVK